MSIEADLVAGLRGHAGLSALVGTRIYADRLPQGPILPAITYSRIATPHQQVLTRAVVSAAPRFQLTIWARTPNERISVAAELHNAVLTLTGVSVALYGVQIVGERDMAEPVTDVYRRDLDVVLLHAE